MKYRILIIFALTALCIIGCENGKKNTARESNRYSGRPDSLQYDDSVQYTNVDTVYGHFRGKGVDTLLVECVDSASWRLYSPSGKLAALDIKYARGLYIVDEGDLDGNGTDEIGIRREQEMGNWQDYNVFTYHNGKWCYLMPSTTLYHSHFYEDLNYGQDAVKSTKKKGYVQVYYSLFDDDIILSDTIIKINPIPVDECDGVPVMELYKEFEDEEEGNAIETTFEVNEKAGKDLVRYKNDVEKEFQKLIGLSPENKDLFLKEKKLWEKYYEAVKTVARIEDNEGSYLLFYYVVLEQAIRLRHESIYNLLQNLQGKSYKFFKTRFTKKMVEESYKSFRASISEVNELYYPHDSTNMAEHKESLKEEEKCWNEWMAYRSVVSSKLPEDIRSVYDGCTNLTIREKLRQVKNQNQALGITGDEPLNCILPKDCSDKALLEYPGFDKVWAKHCKDLDWYPTFK